MHKCSAAWAMLITSCLLRPAILAETVPLAQVVAPYLGDGLELAIIPSPQEAKLEDRLLVAPRLEIEAVKHDSYAAILKDAQRWAASLIPSSDVQPTIKVHLGQLGDSGPADRVIRAMGLIPSPERQTAMGDQGYVLYVGNGPKTQVPIIAVAGVGPAGTYYGLQSLKQLTVARDGKVYVRIGQITDWPAMPWRGSKRPFAWEELYKANFGALRGEDNKDHFRIFFGAGADPQRGLKSWEWTREFG